jgi:hypothetical protein
MQKFFSKIITFFSLVLQIIVFSSKVKYNNTQVNCILNFAEASLTPVILAIQEAEIKRVKVWSQPRQVVLETLFQKNPSQKGLAQGKGPEFKTQYHKKKKFTKNLMESFPLTYVSTQYLWLCHLAHKS